MPDFSLSLAQPSVDALRGQTIDLDLRIQRVGGYSKPVTVMAPDLSELKIKFPTQTLSTEGSSVRFTLKIKKAPVGTHQLVFVGRDDSGRQRPVTLNLTVRKN